jgi:hypothetical protein
MVDAARASAARAATPLSPNQSLVFVAICWLLHGNRSVAILESPIRLRGSLMTNHYSPTTPF